MQRLLYISPVLPRRCGHGLEQRAYRMVEALSHRYRVSLLMSGRALPNDSDARDLRSLCDEVIVLPLSRWTAAAFWRRALRRFFPRMYRALHAGPSDLNRITSAGQEWLADRVRDRFAVIHVHRLRMLPLLRSCPALANVTSWVDLDDVESITRNRLAGVARSNGQGKMASVMQRDAERYRAIEQRELSRFDRVFVCSGIDRVRLLGAGSARNVDVLPNVVDVFGHAPRAPRLAGAPFVFLFVGTTEYYPNRDAVAFLCRDVAPAIRGRLPQPFEIRIVSDAAPRTRRMVPDIPELSWAPPGVELSLEYQRADAVIVPIRAGGGTRIKVLEAFARRAPVITTAIGAEGLDVVHGEHALVGETAAELAEHAVTLMRDAGLRDRLADRAFALVEASYTPAALRRRIGEIMDQPAVAS